MAREFVLTLQFPHHDVDDYDRIVELEEIMMDLMVGPEILDGHDWGGGEMNIFIFTPDPAATFNRVVGLVEERGLAQVLKAAYREINEEDYVVLYPPGETQFEIH